MGEEGRLDVRQAGISGNVGGAGIPRSGYLLDSGSPYRLWFLFRPGFGVKNPIQGNGLDCHSLLHEPEE
ncbi:MAG: hypothetical protein DMG57_13770, partial [Acidobacteria bacterium]